MACDHEFTLWCSKQRSESEYIRWRMDRVSAQVKSMMTGVHATMTARDEHLYVHGGHTRNMESITLPRRFIMDNDINAIVDKVILEFDRKAEWRR